MVISARFKQGTSQILALNVTTLTNLLCEQWNLVIPVGHIISATSIFSLICLRQWFYVHIFNNNSVSLRSLSYPKKFVIYHVKKCCVVSFWLGSHLHNEDRQHSYTVCSDLDLPSVSRFSCSPTFNLLPPHWPPCPAHPHPPKIPIKLWA